MESIRSCVVCRTRAEKHQLLRFVRALDGEICFDEKGDLNHRGAFICSTKACLEKALKKRALFRNERVLPVEPDAMLSLVTSRLKKTALSRLGLIRRLGRLEMGKDAVMGFVRANKADAVILARDFSARSIKDVMSHMANFSHIEIVTSTFSMDELGQSIGREKTGVVALSKGRITDEVIRQMKKIKELAH